MKFWLFVILSSTLLMSCVNASTGTSTSSSNSGKKITYNLIDSSAPQKPSWIYQLPEYDGKKIYFVGQSNFSASEHGARNDSRENAAQIACQYAGATGCNPDVVKAENWYIEKYASPSGTAFRAWVLTSLANSALIEFKKGRENSPADSPKLHTVVPQKAKNPAPAAPKINPPVAKKDSKPPEVRILSPQVHRGIGLQVKDARLAVTGIAIDVSGVAEVVINGQPAALDAQGNFSATVLLKVGENRIDVVALDTRGNKGYETFKLSREAMAPAPAQTKSKPDTALVTGRYFALIIGVKDYSDPAILSLDHPLQDARQVYDTLTSTYTFAPENVVFLKNPSRAGIIDALDKLANRLTENDNLLVFYAGHGYWDERLKQGFWLPADASKNSRSRWLSNSTLKDYIGGIRSKHTLLIADACFSGGIFKTRSAFNNAPKAMQELYKLPSRKAMTSGAMKEVPDRSVFVQYMLKRLQGNSETYLSSEQLFASMRQAVINNSPNGQVPQFGEIRETGDEGGDFVFVKR